MFAVSFVFALVFTFVFTEIFAFAFVFAFSFVFAFVFTYGRAFLTVFMQKYLGREYAVWVLYAKELRKRVCNLGFVCKSTEEESTQPGGHTN